MRERRSIGAPWWALAALVWVVVQGLFGKYTVTLRLYPAVVTAHLLGGMVLLALLVAQLQSLRRSPPSHAARAAAVVLALLALQIVLGGWVSSNYAVLACRGFPQCNGQWWPEADYAQGFTLLRELGRDGSGGYVDFNALVAIQMVHRVVALLVSVAVIALSIRLWRGAREDRRAAIWLLLLLAVQVFSGLSNVLLDWPLLAALLHTAGAAALVALLTSLACVVARREPPRIRPSRPAGSSIEPRRHDGHHHAGHHRAAAPRVAPVAVHGADQAARGAADRVLRGDRHVARGARGCPSGAWRWRRRSASGWWPAPRRRSTAWSSGRSIARWRAPRGGPPRAANSATPRR